PGLVPTTTSTGLSGFQVCAEPAAGARASAATSPIASLVSMSDASGLVFGMAQLAPGVEFARIFLQRFLIHIDAQARRGGQVDVAILRLQLVRRNLVAKIDERQEVLGNSEIRHRRRGMD